jgi:solute carrier family 8 (sodium/calcium exchanger)
MAGLLPVSIRGSALAAVLLLSVMATTTYASNATDTFSEGINCDDGLIVPIWRPYDNLSLGDRFGRGILYTLLMVYLFIGVSIVSDRFMESIEMITAQEKEVTIKDPKSGRNQGRML